MLSEIQSAPCVFRLAAPSVLSFVDKIALRTECNPPAFAFKFEQLRRAPTPLVPRYLFGLFLPQILLATLV